MTQTSRSITAPANRHRHERSLVVQGRHHLSGARKNRFFDSNNDGIGDFAGLMPQKGSINIRRTRALPLAIWLLPFYPSQTPATTDTTIARDTAPSAPDYGTIEGKRGAFIEAARCAQYPRHHRAGHQPYQRPASLVPGSPQGARGLALARLLCLSDDDKLYFWHPASSFSTPRNPTGPGTQGGWRLFLAPVLFAPAGSQLRQSRRASSACLRPCIFWLDAGIRWLAAPTPCPI